MSTVATTDQATEELWREMSGPLLGYLRQRTTSAADADDLLQEVFLRVHRQIRSLRDTSKLQGWVYRIARNAVIDHVRTRGSRSAVVTDSNAVAEAGEPTGTDAIDLTPSLRRFISELPELYRDALVRHEFQGQPIRDVARALGVSETAAKSRVRRARLLLREMLDRCCRFEFDRRGRVIEAEPRASCDCRVRKRPPA